MALKGDREVLLTSIRYKIEAAKDAERGIILAADSTDGVAKIPTTVADLPVGLLLDDVENLDFTVRPQILSRNVVPRGSEVSLLVKGVVLTNKIQAASVPAQGGTAYLEIGGLVATSGSVVVGKFDSAKDADGYATLRVDL